MPRTRDCLVSRNSVERLASAYVWAALDNVKLRSRGDKLLAGILTRQPRVATVLRACEVGNHSIIEALTLALLTFERPDEPVQQILDTYKRS